VISRVKEHLDKNKPCILIATQLVEAGVDFDFPVVYREIAPLDRIIQTVGDESFCFVFRIEGERPLEAEEIGVGVTEMFFRKYGDTKTYQEQDVVEEYFREWYRRLEQNANRKSVKIREAMEKLDFPLVQELCEWIPERDEISVIIAYGNDAEKVKAYVHKIEDRGTMTKADRRWLASYTVNVSRKKGIYLAEPLLDGKYGLYKWGGEYDGELGVMVTI
jgi:CRISPR-associated endonuclease/helicase Cas3